MCKKTPAEVSAIYDYVKLLKLRLEGFVPDGSIGAYRFVTQADFAAVTSSALDAEFRV